MYYPTSGLFALTLIASQWISTTGVEKFGSGFKDSSSDTLGHGEVLMNTVPSIELEKFEDSLYYFGVIFKTNYYRAMQFCKYHDMELLSIESKEENDFLLKHVQSLLAYGERQFWTSGTKMMGDVNWVWMSTGRPMVFKNWGPNQPDNKNKTENCLEVKYHNQIKDLIWNDRACNEEVHWVCETTVPKSISSIVADNCNVTIYTVPVE